MINLKFRNVNVEPGLVRFVLAIELGIIKKKFQVQFMKDGVNWNQQFNEKGESHGSAGEEMCTSEV
jgi:hypothetical protein